MQEYIDQIFEGSVPAILHEFPENAVDLTVTSPPYDHLRGYDHQPEWDFQGTAVELFRITKPGGVVVWVVGDATVHGSETGSTFRQALFFMDVGFRLHDTMIYHKTNPTPLNHNRYEQSFEYMLVLSKGRPATFTPIRVPVEKVRPVQKDVHHQRNHLHGTYNLRGNSRRGGNATKIKGNIWSYSVGKWVSTKDEEAFAHPAIFPEGLASDHILSWSRPGELVLDPFCGSGTTCKMAMLLDRHFIGIDISAKYVAFAQQRIERARAYMAQKCLQGPPPGPRL